MDLICIVAGGPPLSWAIGATQRHGAPHAARLAHRPPATVTQCACGVVAHPDALAAMGHDSCVPAVELACSCGVTFGLSVAALEAHTKQEHGRKATNEERMPK